MKRVTGIGGVFFKVKNPKVMRDWYRKHLGIDVQEWGGAMFKLADASTDTTAWAIKPVESDSFNPGSASFMVNYLVDDLEALHAALKDEGCNVFGEIQDSEYGKFGYVIDPEGNKIELWEPKNNS